MPDSSRVSAPFWHSSLAAPLVQALNCIINALSSYIYIYNDDDDNDDDVVVAH